MSFRLLQWLGLGTKQATFISKAYTLGKSIVVKVVISKNNVETTIFQFELNTEFYEIIEVTSYMMANSDSRLERNPTLS